MSIYSTSMPKSPLFDEPDSSHYDHLVNSMKPASSLKTTEQYIREIEVQAKKPLTEQIEDLKVAGATLLTKLDTIIEQLDRLGEQGR